MTDEAFPASLARADGMSGVQLALGGILNDMPEVTAYHEAGHAVACHAVGVAITYMTIIPRGASFGHVASLHPRFPTRCDLDNQIRIRLAGPVAEAHYQGFRDWEINWTRGDYATALRDAEELYGGLTQPALRHIRRLQRETKGFVAGEWRRIDRLAGALLKRQHLTGSEIAEVLVLPGDPRFDPQHRNISSRPVV